MDAATLKLIRDLRVENLQLQEAVREYQAAMDALIVQHRQWVVRPAPRTLGGRALSLLQLNVYVQQSLGDPRTQTAWNAEQAQAAKAAQEQQAKDRVRDGPPRHVPWFAWELTATSCGCCGFGDM